MIMVYPPSLPLIDHDDYFPAFEGGGRALGIW